jgi:hypothetical protein
VNGGHSKDRVEPKASIFLLRLRSPKAYGLGTRIPVDLVADMLAQGATSGGESGRPSDLEQGTNRHRTVVHARVSTAGTTQPTSLADKKGERPEVDLTEHSSHLSFSTNIAGLFAAAFGFLTVYTQTIL